MQTGCTLRPSFYLLVIIWAFAGFVIATLISENIAIKIVGAVILGFIGASISIDKDCFKKNETESVIS